MASDEEQELKDMMNFVKHKNGRKRRKGGRKKIVFILCEACAALDACIVLRRRFDCDLLLVSHAGKCVFMRCLSH